MAVTKVVILNWNGVKHLKRFLPGVVLSTPADVEIVVADNGSTDDSLDLLRRRFPTVRVLELGDNYGFAGGYNRALAQLEADYFVLLNSDVETPRDWLEPLVSVLEMDRTMAAVAPKILSWADKGLFEYAGACGGFIDRYGYPFCRGRIIGSVERDEGQYDQACDVFWASGACFCCRADLFREAGGFDESFFAHMEEIDLCWRLQIAGYKIGVEPSSCVYHVGGGTLAPESPRKLYFNYRNSLYMLFKNLPSGRMFTTLFIRMLLDGASAAVYLLQGKWRAMRAVMKAHGAFYMHLGQLRRSRRKIEALRVSLPETVYGGSVVWDYFIRRRKTFGSLDF